MLIKLQNLGNSNDNILVFSVKLALILICSAKLQEKYGYLYKQLADHNACLSKASLFTFLSNICKIMEMLGETTAYGHHHIQPHIDSCFINSQGCLGVTETEFAAWIMQDPPLLTWLTTFNRISCAENIFHNVRCSTCKVTPIQGPRYSCLKCPGYHQCKLCFFFGKISNKHKLKHPVREYCIKTTNRDITKLIIELIRNKLRLCPTRTIAVNSDDPPSSGLGNETVTTEYTSIRSTAKRRILSDPQRELQSIINHLEEENKQLQVELLDIRGTKAERLQRHRATIESQLQRLKLLKKYLFTSEAAYPQTMTRMQSTPMLHGPLSRIAVLPIDFELSPIISQEATEGQSNSNNRKELAALKSFNATLGMETINEVDKSNNLSCTDTASASSGFGNMSQNTHIELSTWIGGANRSNFHTSDSGFSQWLGHSESNSNGNKFLGNPSGSNNDSNEPIIIDSHSPIGYNRDNTPSSLQRPDKHSQHSSLQNIQGDLNDILDRLQNMVANDCLLEESYVGNDNCKLKRATTEMEDLLTGLIEGMESRKSKLTTIV
ncbi:dystrophin-1-like isoform X2 [Prorops nasuta]|uniref:dystrophin-1-like isoform X2 n=1 Tax=Prorops nasuta TaxID=863751 RepID=UPI0034CFEBE3